MIIYFFQKLAWTFCVLAMKFFLRFRVEGKKNIKAIKEKQYCIIANHRGYLDAFLICASIPFFHFIKLDLRYMIRPSLLRYFPFARLFGVYPVHRKQGSLEKTLVKTEKFVRRGKSLLIFPEGTISRENKPLPARQGISYLAKKYNLLILPMAIYDSWGVNPKRFFLRKHRARVKIGSPFFYNDVAGSNDDYNSAAQKIMNRVNEML